MVRPRAAKVAASSEFIGDDGIRQPGGEVHAWTPGMNQTLCGLALSRTGLKRFPHVPFDFRLDGPFDWAAYDRAAAGLDPRKAVR
jgi:hypothetical protein